MTMARFPHRTGPEAPAWLEFIWAVNTVRPDTFGAPTYRHAEDRPGYETEHYPGARVIYGPGDEGVRIVADDDETAEAFRTAAAQLNIHLTGGPATGGPATVSDLILKLAGVLSRHGDRPVKIWLDDTQLVNVVDARPGQAEDIDDDAIILLTD